MFLTYFVMFCSLLTHSLFSSTLIGPCVSLCVCVEQTEQNTASLPELWSKTPQETIYLYSIYNKRAEHKSV